MMTLNQLHRKQLKSWRLSIVVRPYEERFGLVSMAVVMPSFGGRIKMTKSMRTCQYLSERQKMA